MRVSDDDDDGCAGLIFGGSLQKKSERAAHERKYTLLLVRKNKVQYLGKRVEGGLLSINQLIF